MNNSNVHGAKPHITIGGGGMKDGISTVSVIDPDGSIVTLSQNGQRQDITSQIDSLHGNGKGKGIKQDDANHIEV